MAIQLIQPLYLIKTGQSFQVFKIVLFQVLRRQVFSPVLKQMLSFIDGLLFNLNFLSGCDSIVNGRHLIRFCLYFFDFWHNCYLPLVILAGAVWFVSYPLIEW